MQSGKGCPPSLQRVNCQDLQWGEQCPEGAHFSSAASFVALVGRRMATRFRVVWNDVGLCPLGPELLADPQHYEAGCEVVTKQGPMGASWNGHPPLMSSTCLLSVGKL